MKFLVLMLLLMFLFNQLGIKVVQFIYQNIIYMMFLLFMSMYPMMGDKSDWVKVYYVWGLDMYSFGLIVLSMWIFSLMVLVSSNYLDLNYKSYFYILNFMMIFLIVCFMSMNLLSFYLFFESSLIPVFMLILGWGGQVDRVKAGLFMMLYTLVGSMPLLVSIFFCYNMSLTLLMNFINISNVNIYVYISLILAFLIKLPMYIVHLWLPKAHVEAPVVGSMILAGVMLKLGGYGLMRVMNMMVKICLDLNKFIIVLSLVGGVYCSLMCLFQVDMKMLVAYSSIVHMSIFLSGVMTMFSMGVLGGILMMIAHGLCSSGLFMLVNMNYERLNTRSLMLSKGVINIMPVFSLMWFLLCSSNMSFPPSLNLWSEVMLISSIMIWNKIMFIMLMMILLFSACYSLYLFSFSQHGESNQLIYIYKGIFMVEFMGLIKHWVPLNYLFMYMYIYK